MAAGGGALQLTQCLGSLEGLQALVQGRLPSPPLPWGAGFLVQHGWRGHGLWMAPSAPARGDIEGQLLPGSPAWGKLLQSKSLGWRGSLGAPGVLVLLPLEKQPVSILVPASSLVPRGSGTSAAATNTRTCGIARRVGADPHGRGGPCSGTHKWAGVGVTGCKGA